MQVMLCNCIGKDHSNFYKAINKLLDIEKAPFHRELNFSFTSHFQNINDIPQPPTEQKSSF